LPDGYCDELISRAALLGVVVLAGVLLFTRYEVFLEGLIALVIVATVLAGSLMHPRKDVFYVRTAVRLIDPERKQAVERDFLAVKLELVRLWLLFLPTGLAVAFLVFFAAGGAAKFSVLNWIFSRHYLLVVGSAWVLQLPPLFALVLLSAWISERRILRDAEACSARSFSVSRARVGRIGRVSYLFMGEQGEYYGGDCMYFGFAVPPELATIVFHKASKPELNKIAMGLLFHRLVILGRGVTDLDKQTTAAQMALADTRVPVIAPD
jgi:hypothetical protein